MLFDKDTGKAVSKTPVQEEKAFDIRMMATRDAKGNLQVANTSPPELSGKPQETYHGPGSKHDGKPNNDWEPISPSDAYNLKCLRVSSGMLGIS